MLRPILSGTVLIAIATFCQAQTVIYVDDDTPASTMTQDGNSWSTSFAFLQDALDSAGPGDQIHVAGGIYRPDLEVPGLVGPVHNLNNPDESFVLPGSVIIEGGYAGLADPLNPDQRDISIFASILSGNILNPSDPNDNIHTIVKCVAGFANDSTRLDGFRIEGAYNNSSGTGGGIFFNDSDPTIANCTINNNQTPGTSGSGHGGGLYFFGTTSIPLVAKIQNCTLISNTAGKGGGVAIKGAAPQFDSVAFVENVATLSGGGVNLFYGGAAFTACTFTGNVVDALPANLDGGGAYFCEEIASAPEFRQCVFEQNVARNSPGGAVTIKFNEAAFIRCLFRANWSVADQIIDGSGGVSGGRGGAMYVDGGGNIIDCSFVGNVCSLPDDGGIAGRGGAIYVQKYVTTLVNSEFYRNEATRGAGLYAANTQDPYQADVHAYNLTFTQNIATQIGGGADALGTSSAGGQTFTNCIFWHNNAASVNPILNNLNATSTLAPAEYSCIEDDAVGGTIPYSDASNGNIDADPLFTTDYPAGPLDLRLRANSPCIDAGNTPPVPADLYDIDAPPGNTAEKTPDLLIRKRVVDNPYVVDTGIATDESNNCGVVDMGAFEDPHFGGGGSGLLGDVDNNGTVNGLDIQPFVWCYLDNDATTPDCTSADMNHDYVFTFDDVTCFINALLMQPTCPPILACDQQGSGEGGGESQSMIGSGESEGMAAGGSEVPEAPEDEVEDPAFTARWNAFVEWLDANWIDAYPDMTEEAWNDMTTAMMIDMVYEGVAP